MSPELIFYWINIIEFIPGEKSAIMQTYYLLFCLISSPNIKFHLLFFFSERVCLACVCVLDRKGSWVLVVQLWYSGTVTVVVWMSVDLTGYGYYLTGFHKPLSPPYSL